MVNKVCVRCEIFDCRPETWIPIPHFHENLGNLRVIKRAKHNEKV